MRNYGWNVCLTWNTNACGWACLWPRRLLQLYEPGLKVPASPAWDVDWRLTPHYCGKQSHVSEPMNCQVEARYEAHEFISKNRPSRALRMRMGSDDREDSWTLQSVKSGPITHFCRVRFNVPGDEPEDISFLIISLPQFSVVLGLPWLRSHRAIIDLNRNRLVFAPEVICSSLEIQASSILSPSVSTVTVSVSLMSSSVKPLEVYAINSASFVRLTRKKNHILFTVILRDIKKALITKSSVDSITILSLEYHDFLNVFSRKASDTLLEH